ncbi:MAG: penicillin-binding transpeptidase domain-containing protein, partial [Candidatus Berkelbacteria bacterium]|nr:penicillin-binding transpeptidase domain-containing protein [Candidatus Berkelbacteria bacterium]
MKTGIAFADHIKTEKIKKRRFSYSDETDYKLRDFLLPLGIFFFLGILIFKLVSLQIINGSYYQLLSDKNRTRTNLIHAPRGIIFDRNGIPLVFNLPGFRETKNGKTKVLTREEAMSLIASGKTDLEVDSLRFYPKKDALSHVLGYTGQITKEELSLEEFTNYNSGDLIGKSGIEKEYEKNLRGVDGKELIEVDALGKKVRTLGLTDPIPGQNITLTIDANLQQAVFEALKDVKKSAVIVSSPKGEILSLVSKPSFDPNLFTMGEGYEATDAAYKNISSLLLDSENQPFLNRAISGAYPPGSTFKLVTAAAGLENKVIDENFTVEDNGVINVGAFSFSNWYFTQYGRTEGAVNVVKAIKRSNDIFFYKLAEKVGVDKLAETARKFGLGQKTGIDLGGEVSGLVPDPEWKKKTIGESWYLGDVYHYGIGQGYLLTTPLQVNMFTQAVANKGTLYKPQFLKNSKFEIRNSKLLSEKTFSLIR